MRVSLGPTAGVKEPAVLPGIRELLPKYKGVLLDQFGVLHDGRAAYPDAIAAVRHLSAAGQQLLVLSNSSRRSNGALGKLAKMGFPESAFMGAVTSGEMTHQALSTRPSPWWQALGNRCLHITWDARGAISLAGLGLETTSSPGEAGFVLAHGTEAIGQGDAQSPVPTSLEGLKTMLRECAQSESSIPMIVANPDIVTVSGKDLITMPGTLAKWYREFGGEVHLMGKPAKLIYDGAMEVLGLHTTDILAIGDSLEHDIAGAQSAGIASAFICDGIHSKETLTVDGQVDMEGVMRLCDQFGAWPDFVMPRLVY